MVKQLCRGFLLGFIVLLAGCSVDRGFTTQLNSFQRWPAQAQGARYIFANDFNKNIEDATYANFLRPELAKIGLVETDNPKRARFVVGFNYATEAKQQTIREEQDDPFFDNYMFGRPSPFSAFYFMSTPTVRVSTVNYNRYSLGVGIRDIQQARLEVYRANVVADSSQASLAQVMPFLAASVFDKFPGQSGQVRTVTFKLNDDKK